MVTRKRVLIVDDEPTVLEFMRRVLSRNAYDCRTARDSGQALDEMNKQPADVVVTDIHMPGSDGAWLLNAIKNHWPDVPVIVLTGDDEAETAMACVKSGAADYLVKPIEIPRLLAAVRTALGLGDADRIDSPTAKT